MPMSVVNLNFPFIIVIIEVDILLKISTQQNSRKGVFFVEADMKFEEVRNQIQKLKEKGEPLAKKKVKQNYPKLLKNALFYFPSWEHAVESCNT
jgi:hypothetical protein